MRQSVASTTFRHTVVACMLAVGVVACGSPEVTSIALEVDYDDTWQLTELHVAVGDRTALVAGARTVTVLVPDDWDGVMVDVEVRGMRDTVLRARGKTTATVIARATVRARLRLEPLPCGAWCTPGAMTCDGGTVVECVVLPDGCNDWGAPLACGGATPYCSLGTCLADCIDECTGGETRCAGPDGVQACGQADQDSCRDWKAVTPCGAGTTCSNGVCRADCVDECSLGASRCVGSGVATCGDVNLDDCTEWSPAAPCDTGICDGGACAVTCSNECTTSTCSDSSWRQCGQYDLDDCMDLSPGTSCVAVEPCQEGICTPTTGCEQVARVCDSPPPAICVDDATYRTFATTGMCAAGGCDYPSIDEPCAGGCANGVCTCPGTCAPEVYASGANQSIAIDATHVYWLSGLEVRRRSKVSGLEELVATMNTSSLNVIVDGTHVYWAEGSPSGGVRRRSKALGASVVESVSTGHAMGLAVDATHVYWTTGPWGEVKRRVKTLASSAETVASGQTDLRDCAVDGSHVYWTGISAGVVRRRAKSLATGEELVASAQPNAYQLAFDDAHVYWTAGGSVNRRSKALGATIVETVWTAPMEFNKGIAVDSGYVYWTAREAAMRRETTLAAPAETLATTPGYLEDMAVDDTHVYWTNLSADLRRLSRCACDL